MRVAFAFLLGGMTCLAQSYAPAVGMPGATAIVSNSPVFVAWATGITVTRGSVTIADPEYTAAGSATATAGQPESTLGPYSGGSVSLGDGGEALLTFASPIIDGEGFDFAIFENGVPGYLELAFVEASSDGINFFRFPGHSQTQTETQLGTFGTPLPPYLNNLAGKYGGIYGTPFDLADLPDDALLDKDNITDIKVIDVVGSINPDYATYDSYGNIINDSFPTPFVSSGFDLQGVGVIHQKVLGLDDSTATAITPYPNPATDHINIIGLPAFDVTVYDMQGMIAMKRIGHNAQRLDIAALASGLYMFVIRFGGIISAYRVLKK